MTEAFQIKPAISVVIATKGTKTDLLTECINSINNQTFRNFEVVLVYSVFPQALNTLIMNNAIIPLKEKGKTLGSARNYGVKHAKADIVAFIDDDAIASPDWLSNINSLFSQYPNTVCIGGPHITPTSESNGKVMRLVEGMFAEILMGQKVIEGQSAVGKIAGCNVAYRKEFFKKIGQLNETYRSGEDWELHIRLCENGYMIRFDPSVWVWHHRQGLKHAFLNSANMFPFFMSWRTIKIARHEPFFVSYYLTNVLFLVLLFLAFTSSQLFLTVLLLSFSGYFLLNFLQLKSKSKIIYFPLSVLFTMARIGGFYYGLFKNIALSMKKSGLLRKRGC